MVETDKKDTGGAMEAHTHSAKQQWTINFNRKDNYFMHKTQYTLDIDRDWEESISLIHRALTSLHGLHFFFLPPRGKRELSPRVSSAKRSQKSFPTFQNWVLYLGFSKMGGPFHILGGLLIFTKSYYDLPKRDYTRFYWVHMLTCPLGHKMGN